MKPDEVHKEVLNQLPIQIQFELPSMSLDLILEVILKIHNIMYLLVILRVAELGQMPNVILT